MTLSAGARLGPYEVISPLGAGGMGEVYRARDTRLGRDVAVKVIPEELAAHEDRVKRFEREARLAGSLNHPNVLALYDVGSHDGVPYLVTELLEGGSLRDLLKDGPLPVRKVVEVAQQIARGLDAAHARGVVHRDLKPANIFVTKEGHVKILDFGLAKLTQAESRDLESSDVSTATGEGRVVGTLGYMAPEQVRGQAADPRSDIFAFGTVLYEMLAGRRAFGGDTAADTMTAILTRDPEELSRPGLHIPPGLERVVRRCLEKDPEERFQSARDVAFALDAGSDTGPSHRTEAAVPQWRRWPWMPARAAFVALAGLAAAAFVLWHRPPAVPHVTAIRKVTHDGSLKASAFTDGTRVYYTGAGVVGPGFRLLQVPLAGGDSVSLDNPFHRPFIQAILPSRGELVVEEDVRPMIPDQLWLVSTTGGGARPLGDIEAEGSTPSFDGQRLVFSRGREIFVARSDGSSPRRLLTAPAAVVAARLSPDGQRLRYTVGGPPPSIWEATADGGGAHLLIPGWNACCGVWTPDGRYYVFNATRDGETDLWARREVSGWPWRARAASEPSRLTSGPMAYSSPSVSPDGHTIIALGQAPSTLGELVRYDVVTAALTTFLGGLSARDLEFSRDGRWIAYVRHPEGTLWRSRPDGTERRQLTFPPETTMLPRWSPDGQRIAYTSQSPGEKWTIRIVAAEGGKPQPLTGQPGVLFPTWSPDGAKLAFGGWPPDHMAEHPIRIQVLDLLTGKVSAVPGSEGLYAPHWSPDGQSIAAASAAHTRLALYEFAAGRWKDVIADADYLGYPSWTRDGTRIQLEKAGSIVRVRVADGRVERVTSPDWVRFAAVGVASPWTGIAPDDSPLMLRDLNGQAEVYALDIEWP